jgi:glycosyltransferase involved in cell wall biosynthesis
MRGSEGQDVVGECELSVVIPCLNEARTLGLCIQKAQGFFRRDGVAGEVVVADNGSTDGSQEIAAGAGARVVSVPQRGYGAALRAGFEAARGRYVVMGDGDDSYDFSALAPFLERLRAGDDLVVGNRFRGGIAPGAMPPMHQYLGNPLLSLFARIFFRVPIGDVYCGLRGMRREVLSELDLQSSGMEFALEMIVKARLLKMRISEVPTTLSPDGRGRPPHLNTWRDGRRSLLLYLASMPSGMLLYPGAVLMTLGLVVGTILVTRPISIYDVRLDVHTLLYCSAAVLLGFQLVTYSIVLRFLMVAARLLPPDAGLARRVGDNLRLEHGLSIALVFITAGLGGVFWLFRFWEAGSFGNLDPFLTMRIAIPSATAITLGFQVAFAALFISLAKWHVRARASG